MARNGKPLFEEALRILDEHPAEALKIFDTLLQKEPYNAEIVFYKGKALFLLNRFEQASFYLKLAAALAPDLKGSADELLAEIEAKKTAILFPSKESRMWVERGHSLTAAGDFESAIKAFDKALELNPLNKEALAAKADALAKLARYDEAAACYQKILSLVSVKPPVAPVPTVPQPPPRAEEEIDAALEGIIREIELKPVVAPPERAVPPRPAFKPPAPPAPPVEIKPMERLINGFVDANGRLAGRLDGLRITGRFYRMPSAAIGRVRGGINGRGRVRGLLNGRRKLSALINGRGRIKGSVNGKKMAGYLNGFVAHIWVRDTMVNGKKGMNGFANGRAAMIDKRKAIPVPRVWDIFAVFAIIGLVVCIGGILYLPPYMPMKIKIDADFTDWLEVEKFCASPDATINQNVDIINYSVLLEYNTYSFYIKVSGKMLAGSETKPDAFFIFIDCDATDRTGYLIKGMGADYMIHITGHKGKLLTSAVYLYDYRLELAGLNWNAWHKKFSVPTAVAEHELETQILGHTIGISRGVKVVFLVAAKSFDGQEDFSDALFDITNKNLIVEQRSTGKTIHHRGENVELLTITMQASQDTELLELKLQQVGNATLRAISCKVYGAAVPPQTAPVIDGWATFKFKNFTFFKNVYNLILVYADLSFTEKYSTVGLRINTRNDIKISEGVVTLRNYLENYIAYIERVPDFPVGDGAFSDWSNVKVCEDYLKDVPNPNVDIVSFGVYKNSNTVFYLRMGGELFAGTAIPWVAETIELAPPGPPAPPVVDTDSDTIPDEYDPYPYDFDNDGTPDAEEYYDVDSDGLKDYPYGNDFYLNTTIPARPPFPENFWNVTVSIFISPVIPVVIVGGDEILIFIDADDNASTGYAIKREDFKIGADYLINFTGKHNAILTKGAYKFVNGRWLKVEKEVSAQLDTAQLEIQTDILFENSSTISVLFVAQDWHENADYAAQLSAGGMKRFVFSTFPINFVNFPTETTFVSTHFVKPLQASEFELFEFILVVTFFVTLAVVSNKSRAKRLPTGNSLKVGLNRRSSNQVLVLCDERVAYGNSVLSCLQRRFATRSCGERRKRNHQRHFTLRKM